MRFSLLFSLLFLTGFTVLAQHLRHKGSLGIQYVEASDSLLAEERVLETRGIWVKSVTPGLTAAALGIQVNDILVAINNIDSLYLYDFQKLEKSIYENEPISITYIRGRRKNRVVGQVVAGRKESSKGEVRYGEVAYNRGYLRTLIHKPYGAARFPAIFYIQDYECNSIDFSKDSLSPVKKLIDGWVKAGYVVFRVEKPGIGESQGTKDCSRLSFQEELSAFQNAFTTFKKLPFVDSTQAFIFGHGVGGSIAPLLAAQAPSKPRGIMVYGSTTKPWFEHMIDIFRKQPLLHKESLQAIDATTRMVTPLLFEWLVQNKSVSDLIQNPDFEAILTSKENPLQYYRGTFFGKAAPFFPELNQQNITQAWIEAATPTLSLHGEFDEKAISPESAQSIAQLVNEVLGDKGSYQLIKNSDHWFGKIKSFEEYYKLIQSKKYTQHIEQNFNHEIVDVTVKWMKQQQQQ